VYGIRHLLLLTLALFFFCNCREKSAEKRLLEAEKQMAMQMDSANLTLDKISHPEQLPEEMYVRYCRMKAVCVINLFSQGQLADSLNNIALNYYRQVQDTVQLKNALHLSGNIHLNTGSFDTAIERFSELRAIAALDEQNGNLAHYDYLISCCHLNKKDYDKALYFSKNALFAIHKQEIQTPYYYKHTGNIFAQANIKDSALVYYRKSLAIASQKENSGRFTSLLYNDIAAFLLSNKEYKEALEYIELGIKHRTNRKDIALFNLTKALVFQSVSQIDSARIYLERSIESSENNYISILAYKYLSDIHQITGNYEQAYYKLLNHKTFFEKEEQRINTDWLTQRYQEEQLKNKNNELKLLKKETEIYLLIFIFLIIIVLIVAWFIFAEEKKKKKLYQQQLREQMLKNQTQIAEHENRLLKQENELMQLREKATLLRESLFRKMSVSEKIPSLDASANHLKESSHKKISLEEDDWKELIQTTNDVFNGFVSRLKKDYPELSADDIRFCCLLKIKVSMQDLADIYCISKAGITKRKTRMKKEKFKLTENLSDLDSFLLTY
jgi:tetratricopeptide (TPR) repeat protein